MRKTIRLLLATVFCIALAGCYQTIAPVKSACLTRWQKGKIQIAEQALTEEQIAQLTTWLQDHPWGWHPTIATYAPETVIWITHSDDTQSPIRIMRTVIVVSQSQRSLSEVESHELHSMLGARNGNQ